MQSPPVAFKEDFGCKSGLDTQGLLSYISRGFEVSIYRVGLLSTSLTSELYARSLRFSRLLPHGLKMAASPLCPTPLHHSPKAQNMTGSLFVCLFLSGRKSPRKPQQTFLSSHWPKLGPMPTSKPSLSNHDLLP